jgi:hypothetical protein
MRFAIATALVNELVEAKQQLQPRRELGHSQFGRGASPARREPPLIVFSMIWGAAAFHASWGRTSQPVDSSDQKLL